MSSTAKSVAAVLFSSRLWIVLAAFHVASLCSSASWGQANARAPKRAPASKPAPAPNLYERLLFMPSPYPKGNWQPIGLPIEDARFQAADGVNLHGWYVGVPNPRAVILYSHGNAGNVSHRATLIRRLARDFGCTVLAYDYRGYGRSEGKPTVRGAIADGRAAWAYLAKRAQVPSTDVVLMGRSLGGAISVQLAAGAKAKGLVLESTFSSLKDVAKVHYRSLAWLVPKSELNSVAEIPKHRGPLLLSHGTKDRTIPYQLGQRLFQAARNPKSMVVIDGGDHNDAQSIAYYQQFGRFLQTLP